MRFVSKFANYRVVLRHGQPSEPMTGRASVPGLYIKFEDGIADVAKEEYCKLMLEHEAYKRDFVLAEGEVDPYADRRGSKEPQHTITQVEYGHIGKTTNPNPPIQLSADKKKLLEQMAKSMAKDMAKDILRELLSEMKDKQATQNDSGIVLGPSDKEIEKPVKPKGRPPKKSKDLEPIKEEVKEPSVEANT